MFSTASNDTSLNSAAPQKIPGVNSNERISLSVSSHVLNEGVIKTHQRQGRGPRTWTSGSWWALQSWWWVNQENERSESVLHAWEMLRGFLAAYPKKIHLEETPDAVIQNIKHCLSLQLLHPSPSSAGRNVISLSHLSTWSSDGFRVTRVLEAHGRGTRDCDWLK